MTQFSVRCAVYRGGTSRGLFFHEDDLPKDKERQKQIFLYGIDADNPSQINGLGSGTSHTSKVIVISQPSVEGADLDYTFYQIGIGERIVDEEGTCGNLMAAVGAFAVDEGIVQTDTSEKLKTVYAYNKNINKMIEIHVPLANGKAKVNGDFLMPGVNNYGAKMEVNILSPGGGKLGKTLPIGNLTTVQTEKKSYEITVTDIVNPFVFVNAEEFGIKGSELNQTLSTNQDLLKELEAIRLKAAVKSKLAKTEEEAQRITSIPKVAIVSSPHDYETSDGRLIRKDDVDIVAKMVSMKKFHRTFAGSGLYNLAATLLLDGTIPNKIAKQKDGTKELMIRIGHPEGIAEVRVALTENQQDVALVGLDRTARRIMTGDLYIPNSM